LLFYHPAVWWLSKRIRAERKIAATIVALALCGKSRRIRSRSGTYGRMARRAFLCDGRKSRTAGFSRHSSSRPHRKASSLRNAGLAFGILCLAAALLAGNALFGLVRGRGGSVF